jgi:hypothetical protein
MTDRRGWGLVAVLCALALSDAAAAGADPQDPPPAPPAPPAPGLAAIGTAMAQTGSTPSGPFGLPDLSALGPALLLAQNPMPAEPGLPAPAAVPNLSAFDPGYLVPLNTDPAAPGEGVAAPGLGPDADSPGTGRLAFLQRLREMYAAGQLQGALLGQRPPGEAPDAGVEATPPAMPPP